MNALRSGPLAVLLSTMLMLVACQAGDGMGDGMADGMGDGMTDGMGDGMTDGMGLGASAETSTLAEGTIDQLLAGPLVWAAYEPIAGDDVEHTHAAGFVYAKDGSHTLIVDGVEQTLAEGDALFLPFGAEHTHRDGSFWDVTLTTLHPDGAPAVDGIEIVFVSEELEGLSAPPVRVLFVDVTLPANGGETAVHQHPGPEFIYVTEGSIEYQTGLSPTEQLIEGDHRALRGDTAVQKRNPSPEPAHFLSWFVVDPARPFSTEAEFH